MLSGHGDNVNSAAYSPDGTRIVTASQDKTARIWDARTGVQLAVLSGHGGIVYSAAYSPDGTPHRHRVSGQDRARSGMRALVRQLAVLSGHGDVVGSAAYSPDGTRIVTASQDKTARIWDARTGAQLAVLSGHGDAVQSAAYSPDGTRIVTASDDKTAAHLGCARASRYRSPDHVGGVGGNRSATGRRSNSSSGYRPTRE